MIKVSKTLLIIIYIMSIMFSISCSNDLEEINALTKKEDLPDIKVKGLVTEYTSGGNLKVKLKTPMAYKYLKKKGGYTLFPEGLKLTFYDSENKIHSNLTAKYGVYEEKKKMAYVRDSVVLTNVNGSVLETEELYFDEKDEKIYSVKPVKITDKGGFEISGTGGFESNIDFTVYRFTDVTGFFTQKDSAEVESENE